jgi:hypothetical protein
MCWKEYSNLSCTCSTWTDKMHWLDRCLLYTLHVEWRKKNDNMRSADFTWDYFCSFSIIWKLFDFITLKDKHNICTLSEHLNWFALAAKRDRKALQSFACLPVSNARTNKCPFPLKTWYFVLLFDILFNTLDQISL